MEPSVESKEGDVRTTQAGTTSRLWARLKTLESTTLGRFVKFGIVGGLGVFVNLGVFGLFHYLLLAGVEGGGRFSVSVFMGIVVSIFTNFIMNDLWTWRDRPKRGRKHWLQRLALYYLFASIAGLVQFLVASTLHQWVWDIHELISDGAGIVAGILINFPFNNRWTFAKGKTGGDQGGVSGKQASI